MSEFQASSHLQWLYSEVVFDLVKNRENRFFHNIVYFTAVKFGRMFKKHLEKVEDEANLLKRTS